MPFSSHRNNLRYEIFYDYYPIFGTLSHILARFFSGAMHYKAETKFCVSARKSVCVLAHAQTKMTTASKFGTEILERFLRSQSDIF